MSRYTRVKKTPLTIVPRQEDAATSLNLQDGMIASRCHCGAEVERYDATGRAWCGQHFYGCIRFTVASHHWDHAGFLADSNAFTIMAWVPKGWPEDRNLDLFAAESETVRAYRKGEITAAQYTQQFSSLMQERLPVVRQWLREHDGQHITLLCACHTHSIEEKFCHRFLVAKLLVWLGCEQVAWEATRQERRVAA